MSLTTMGRQGCLAGRVNSRETSGDRLARRVGRLLALVTVGLLATSGVLYVAMVLLVRGNWPAEGQMPDGFPGVVFRLWSIVDVAVEGSAPTWFNALLWSLLGLSAVAAALFARRRAGWIAFGVVAFLASLDEATSLHERLQDIGWPMAQAFGWGVVYAWVVRLFRVGHEAGGGVRIAFDDPQASPRVATA